MNPARPPVGWSPAQLETVAHAVEVDVSARTAGGRWLRWTPVWVVTVGEGVHVRTWYLREDGWFGHARRSGRARLRLPPGRPGVGAPEAEVREVEVRFVGAQDEALRERVDDAYRSKYGVAGTAAMVTAAAAATTLRLDPHGAGDPDA